MVKQKAVVALLSIFCFASYFSFLATCGKSQADNSLDNVPDYSDCSQGHECQGYLYGVPTKEFKTRGLNVLEAHKIANNMGEDARVIIVEWGIYERTHPDLPEPELTLERWDQVDDQVNDHATNSAGIILGQGSKWGIKGIAPRATAGTAHVYEWFELSKLLKKGDVISCSVGNRIEGHGGVPAFDNPGWLEFLTSTLIKERGVHVVQAAGNDNSNYDELWTYLRTKPKALTRWRKIFDRAVRRLKKPKDTGIILVGGLDPSSGERSSSSNYGSRIPLNAWDAHVTTTERFGRYTHDYDGTSAATPQIAGCVVLLQSISRAKGLGDVKPKRMRQILIESGDEIFYKESESTKRIGRLPDMVKAIGLLHPSLGPVRKRRRSILFRHRSILFRHRSVKRLPSLVQ